MSNRENTISGTPVNGTTSDCLNNHTRYPSFFEIGEVVSFSFYESCGGIKHPARIRAITFTNGKVRYSLQLKAPHGSPHEGRYVTTIRNVDGAFVEREKGLVDTSVFEGEVDNYS